MSDSIALELAGVIIAQDGTPPVNYWKPLKNGNGETEGKEIERPHETTQYKIK